MCGSPPPRDTDVLVARRDTVDSDAFKAFFLEKFADKAEQLEGFDWDAW